MENSFFDRTLSALDQARLQGMLARRQDGHPASASVLAELLDAAEIVPPAEVPGDVATMRSRVLLCDGATGRDFEVTLRYPGAADAAEDAEAAAKTDNSVTVLTPLGLALLGCRVGDPLVWQGADGALVRARFKTLLYQPEAAGDLLD
ncbi:GreA/GreB family elongation factor [Variovorax sp. HJSM1_2]|uniref:GreA/GreB family elongation factor n=1 Tax=Variovorax sp. HJSM1_2 TaxID=3366263 RepID=UPI003BBF7BD8